PACGGDGVTLVSWAGEGGCDGSSGAAVCDYASSTTDCAATGEICVDGACAPPPDPCEPNPCDAPPVPSCEVDGVTLVSWAAEGSCGGGGWRAGGEYARSTAD